MTDNSNYSSRFSNNVREYVGDTAYSLVKIFLYVFAGLIITSVIALGLGAIYRYILEIDYNNGVDANLQLNAVIVLLVLLVASFIAIIVISIVVPITVARGKRSVLVPAILYTIFMGIALSTIAIFIPWYLLGITFMITSVIFAFMALIAFLAKGKLNGLAIAAMGLFMGAGLLSLFLWILMLVLPAGTITWLYWVIVLASFAAMMLITIWDMWRIKKIAEQGEMTNNLSLYCAYILYNDFIYILLKVLRLVLIAYSKKR